MTARPRRSLQTGKIAKGKTASVSVAPGFSYFMLAPTPLRVRVRVVAVDTGRQDKSPSPLVMHAPDAVVNNADASPIPEPPRKLRRRATVRKPLAEWDSGLPRAAAPFERPVQLPARCDTLEVHAVDGELEDCAILFEP